ncbi:MAG: hypothetical protein KIT11_11050 [Fimbriimonadaceae bacterium]|nr:hypothetical protein [Fimbriimonadaceae bacterium]QYK55858.1 MAG: hypothetical protein KF733_12720 [Fimbriimonadaceae bacterium]
MKLSPLTIIILGLAVVIMAFGIGLSQYLPNMEEAQYQKEYAEKLLAEANKQKQANQKVEKAIKDVNDIAAEWQTVVANRTPPQDVQRGGINLAANRWQLTVDSLRFRDSMQRAVNRQVKAGGVTVVQGPTIPPPPDSASTVVETYYNYPAIRFPVVIFDLGQIVVRGTLNQIFENMRSWSNMPNYLAVADGLTVTGTSPELTGTYTVSIVGYIRGDRISPPVPETGGGPGAPGAPAGRVGGAGRGSQVITD